jgi:hypothetical protein
MKLGQKIVLFLLLVYPWANAWFKIFSNNATWDEGTAYFAQAIMELVVVIGLMVLAMIPAKKEAFDVESKTESSGDLAQAN